MSPMSPKSLCHYMVKVLTKKLLFMRKSTVSITTDTSTKPLNQEIALSVKSRITTHLNELNCDKAKWIKMIHLIISIDVCVCTYRRISVQMVTCSLHWFPLYTSNTMTKETLSTSVNIQKSIEDYCLLDRRLKRIHLYFDFWIDYKVTHPPLPPSPQKKEQWSLDQMASLLPQ